MNGVVADAAGGAMDQDRFASLELRMSPEHLHCGDADHRRRSSLVIIERRRLSCDHRGSGQGVLRISADEAGIGHTVDRVSYFEAVNSFPISKISPQMSAPSVRGSDCGTPL